MKKNAVLIIYMTLVFVTAGLCLYEKLLLTPLVSQTFTIPWLCVLNSFVSKPVFWLSVGTILATFFLRFAEVSGKAVFRAFLIAGVAVMAAYCMIATLFLALENVETRKNLQSIMLWVSEAQTIFIIPGFMIGLGNIEDRGRYGDSRANSGLNSK